MTSTEQRLSAGELRELFLFEHLDDEQLAWVAANGDVVESLAGTDVSVAGQLTGNVSATERVVIATGARMVGDVKAARFTIQDGAQFKGHVDMDV